MGFDTRLQYVMGIPAEHILKGVLKKGTRTKYREDTGKPYEVEDNRRAIVFANGHEIVLPEGAYPSEWKGRQAVTEYLQPFGLAAGGDNVMNGVIGMLMAEGHSVSRVQTDYLKAPSGADQQEALRQAQEGFAKAGINVNPADIALHAVIYVSY